MTLQALILLTLSWWRILGALSGEPAEDQFGEEVVWSAFSAKPFVLVIADRDASDNARIIGAALHTSFNGNYTAPETHLRSTIPSEQVKIIPVAALPDVPGVFKWLFRRGFRKEAATGVILDWDSRLSKACGYIAGTVRLVIKVPTREDPTILDVSNAQTAIEAVRAAVL